MGEEVGVAGAETDLVAHVQGEEQHQHPCGRVAAMVPGPVVVHVLEEGRVEDLDLEVDTGQRDPDPDHVSRTGLQTYLVLVHAQELLDGCVRAGGTGRGQRLRFGTGDG